MSNNSTRYDGVWNAKGVCDANSLRWNSYRDPYRGDQLQKFCMAVLKRALRRRT